MSSATSVTEPSEQAPPSRAECLVRWVATLTAMRSVSAVLALYAIGTDGLIAWHGMGFVARGVIDEPAHLATALVVLGAIIRLRRGSVPDSRFCWTMLVCSVLIDVDHIPAEFGIWALTNGTPRPYTHALWTVLVLTLAAVVTRARPGRYAWSWRAGASLVLGGAAAGIAAHFLRDVATAPMALWWPLTDASVQVSYGWYVLALLVLIVAGRSLVSGRGPRPLTDDDPAAAGDRHH